ncbi:Trp biosynthesis-associated membrane protein [Aeromicrobium marinum]|uniref:Trp biosynthesis-associated membrane protein n=1 Tax=Aeromicrobium marinum TaxID=219314 RepID=UPI0001BCD11A|nr:Trp biosynthesis-associated membrane protein [Aeromicrobium marinum]
MNARRLYGPVVLGLVLTGGGAWLAARRPWSTTVVGDGDAVGSTFTLAGSETVPVVGALALVVAAAALGVLSTSGWVRRVVGLVVVAAAAGGAASTFAGPDALVEERLQTVAAFTTGDPVVTDPTAWPWVTAVAFVAAAVLGVLVVLHGHRWPAMSSRYDRTDAVARPVEPTGTDLWKALDDGRDPTL